MKFKEVPVDINISSETGLLGVSSGQGQFVQVSMFTVICFVVMLIDQTCCIL